jgi:RNA polymerase sigma factor (sigma-70 family)
MAVHAQPGSSLGGLTGVDELYRTLASRLERLVRSDVRAPDVVIEDACQFAWSRLVVHRDRVAREAVLSWLVKTAVHEALKLIGRSGRYVSLDAVLAQSGDDALTRVDDALTRVAPSPDELFEQRERLAALGALPERQQRLVWLHALGLSYTEMASHTGCSARTVERQLLRAKRRMREASVDGEMVGVDRAARSGR